MFAGTRIRVDALAKKLGARIAGGLHGEHKQNKRETTMRRFRQGDIRILIATDVAARGIDISSVEHVINYDLPQAAEDYIHRVGRTARAGAEGSALSFIAPGEQHKWRAIQRFMNPGMPEEKSNRERPSRGGRPGSNRRKPSEGQGRYNPRDRDNTAPSFKAKSGFRSNSGRFEDRPKSDEANRSAPRFDDRQRPARSEERSRPNDRTKPAYSFDKKPSSRGDDYPRSSRRDENVRVFSRDDRPRISTKAEGFASEGQKRKSFGAKSDCRFGATDKPKTSTGERFSFGKKGPRNESRSFAAPKPNGQKRTGKPGHSKAKASN